MKMYMNLYRCTLLIAILLGLFLHPDSLSAQTAEESSESENTQLLGTPRATMDTFLSNMLAERSGERGRWRTAVDTLDLGHLTEAQQEKNAFDILLMLSEVIDRLGFVEIEKIPEKVSGKRYVYRTLKNGEIAITQGTDGLWRFSRATIEALPGMLVEVSDRDFAPELAGRTGLTFIDSPSAWFRLHLPKWLFEHTFILENFQWIGLFLFILLGLIADRLLRFFLKRIVIRQLNHREVEFDDELLMRSAKWAGIFIGGIVWLVGLQWIGLPEQFSIILRLAVVFVMTLSGILAAFRIIDLIAGIFAIKAAKTETKFDDVLVPLMRTAAKVFVTAFGIVFVADNLAVDITSLLAGLGIGGLAFALAAKDTIENLFGSITVLMDRPFNIGDWINVDGMDGTVEEIGMRSTRIRTFYNSLITIPNSNLIKAKVDNYGRRKYRRIKTTIAITYNTPPERIEVFCEGIRELIRNHPYTRKDYFHVYLNEFGASSLDILLYCFVQTREWSTELRERHRLFTDIIRLAKRVGVEFAFPTQTLYLERGAGPAKPNEEHFPTLDDVEHQQAEGRIIAQEMVKSLLIRDGEQVHPPEVTFPPPRSVFEMDEQGSLGINRRRGGDSEA